jgi:hypothetical protein
MPGNIQMIAAFSLLFGEYIWHKVIQLFTTESFALCIGAYNPEKGPLPPDPSFKELVPPKGQLWADPFLFMNDERYYLFFEEWQEHHNGYICVVELDEVGNPITPPKVVLKKDYHLSYPFVFQYQGQIFMIPETGHNGTIELYQAVSFPDQWKLEQTLLEDFNVVDSTLLEHDQRWWMFANVAKKSLDSEAGSEDFDELHIFFADVPTGPWTAHPLNPVISDVRSARSAGHIYRFNGILYRPSQDCSVCYGYAVVINKIIELTTESYQEKIVTKILPDWKSNRFGVHTMNFKGTRIVYDYQFYRRRW